MLTIKVNDAEIKNLLQELEAKTDDLTPALKNIGEYLRFRATENFKLESDPEGKPWQKLSPKYARRKAESKAIQKILQFTGDLRSTLAYSVQKRSVTIGTNKKVGSYSLGAIHQFGAPKKRIPARPFLGISESDRKEILLIIKSFLV